MRPALLTLLCLLWLATSSASVRLAYTAEAPRVLPGRQTPEQPPVPSATRDEQLERRQATERRDGEDQMREPQVAQPPIRRLPVRRPVLPPTPRPVVPTAPDVPRIRPGEAGNLPLPRPFAPRIPDVTPRPPFTGRPPEQLQDVHVADSGDSLRIATFNTRLISPIFNYEVIDSAKADVDAQLVADVIASQASEFQAFDIIALNEVWDEDAKDILVKKLAPIFPYYVKKLDVNTDLFGIKLPVPKLEDSGLMLFSRLPLERFRVGSPVVFGPVAFRCFTESSGVDAGAAKGVGLVVVRNPVSRRPYIVAFTHLQDGDTKVRAAQMQEIADLVKQVRQLNPETTRGEAFVMGDLNVEGCSPPDEHPLQWNPTEAAQLEWKSFFWTKNSYFTSPLYDAWAWTTSAFDPGFTSPGGGSRLDYIIHEMEPGHEAYAVQHIHHVMVGQTNSDHIAVVADLNLPSPYCNPRLARRPSLEPQFANEGWDWVQAGKPKVAFFGELKHPGSMQWYRFDAPGTYSMGIPAQLYEQGLRLTVYPKNDLSNPIAIHNQEQTIKLMGTDPVLQYLIGKYHVPEAPFFVRVSNPTNRAWRGKYSMAVHRHKGTSMEDAITLLPGEEPLDPHPPTDKPLNPEDQIWFELITDKAHSGKPQQLEFFTENASGESIMLSLFDDSGANLVDSSKWAATPSIERSEAAAAKWYLTLQRKHYTQSGLKVGWRTNLTWLVGLGTPGAWPFKLICGDETGSDWSGSDEIDLYIDVDGEQYSSHHFADMDSDDHRTMEGMLQPVAFLKTLRIRISENDPDGKSWNECSVWALDPKKPHALRLKSDLLPGDGNYEFRYNFTHALNK